jgi:hypothetical protein
MSTISNANAPRSPPNTPRSTGPHRDPAFQPVDAPGHGATILPPPVAVNAVRSGRGHARPQGTNPPASTAKSPTPSAALDARWRACCSFRVVPALGWAASLWRAVDERSWAERRRGRMRSLSAFRSRTTCSAPEQRSDQNAERTIAAAGRLVRASAVRQLPRGPQQEHGWRWRQRCRRRRHLPGCRRRQLR